MQNLLQQMLFTVYVREKEKVPEKLAISENYLASLLYRRYF